MLTHFHQNIFGWFDWPSLYQEAVREAKDGDLFVEIGSFCGKSTAFLAVEIANSGKRLQKLHAIDQWTVFGGMPMRPEIVEAMKANNGSIFSIFESNMRNGGVLEMIHAVQMDCVAAASLYADESIAFCFLDASHGYEQVLEQLKAWYPKIGKGGVFAGHDYFFHPINNGGVERAVHEFFGKDRPTRNGSCWVVRK